MTLEPGLDPLDEGDCEIGGLAVRIDFAGDSGLDDLAEVTGDTVDAPGDGESAGDQRFTSREVELNVALRPDGTGLVQPGDHDEFAVQLNDLRKVVTLLPDRSQTRLLRWRRTGEQAKRLWYLPAHGKALWVPGDNARQAFANAVAKVRLTCPHPVAVSDDLHSHTFAAGETFDVVNAGSQTMVLPTAWSLTAPGAVTLEHLDYPAEYLRFPTGPVTVTEAGDVSTPSTFGIVYGRESSWFPTWIVLRPGSNPIRASAPCTLSWRDAF